MRRWLLAALLASAGFVLLGAIVIGLWAASAWRGLSRPFPSVPTVEPVIVEIPAGAGASTILSSLEARGVIESALRTRLYLVHVLGDPPLRAGEYRFDRPLAATTVIGQLIEGRVLQHTVTILEGLTLEETADHLAASGFGDHDALIAVMADPAPIADLDPRASNLEGYLFPDTYSFAKGATELQVVGALVANFRRRLETSVLPVMSDSESLRDAVILASIVEREATLDAERATIAGVYRNRLRRSIGLFADPTIIYALKLAGVWDGNLRRPDLKLDSPYNTYVYPGLPPGPICSPGLSSLLAAAAPADVPYLYFVSRNDGSHAFAATLAEHNRNVDIFQRQFFRRR